MFAEVNDNYTLTVECTPIQYRLLCAVFAGVGECQQIRHVPLKLRYSVEQRFAWLTEAVAKMHFSLPAVPQFSIRASGPDIHDVQNAVKSLPAFYQSHCTDSPCQVNLWLVHASAANLPFHQQLSGNDAVICPNAGNSGTGMAPHPVFCESGSDISGLIAGWVDHMILMPYLVFCQERLFRQMSKHSFDVVSRIHMLTRDEPYVVIRVPSRMECGTNAAITLEEFPQSALSPKIGDQNILSLRNGKLLARKQGRTDVSVFSESGQLLQTETVEVYFVKRVTSISLTSDKGPQVLLGDTITIRADCLPQGAVNISKAVWEVIPAQAMRNIGGGRFTTLQPGSCTVRLTIEKVRQEISVTILPAPSDLQLPSEIRCKENASPQRVSASLLPAGSACRTIRCTVADVRVARWDPVSKCVVPVAEGTTTLEATVVDPTGKAMFTRKARITILPEHDIVTPPTLLTLAACCGILAVLSLGSACSALFLTGCMLLCGAAFAVNLIPWVRHSASGGQKIQAVAGAIGAILSMILLFAFS